MRLPPARGRSRSGRSGCQDRDYRVPQTGGPHLGLDVVDVADDDVDDPLGDRGEVPEQQHHGDHSAGNLPCSFGRLKIRKFFKIPLSLV